jgi:polyphosphate kinase 2 (PPK2 family)
MKVWIDMEKTKDFTNSSSKFKECKRCPQRGFKRDKSQVMKDNKWTEFTDASDAYDKIKI